MRVFGPRPGQIGVSVVPVDFLFLTLKFSKHAQDENGIEGKLTILGCVLISESRVFQR